MQSIREIPTLQTPRLLRVLDEVETLAKSEMLALKQEDLLGPCFYNLLTPTVVRYKTELTEECCIHELMHARLWFSRFPVVQLVNPSHPNESLHHIATMLNGTFHHSVFFPELITLGFDPKAGETTGTVNFIRHIHNLGHSRDQLFDQLVAIIYLRASIETSIDPVDQEFAHESLRSGKRIGVELVSLIKNREVSDRHVFVRTLHEAIELLGMRVYLRLWAANAT